MLDFVNKFLSIGVILSQIFLAGSLVAFIFFGKKINGQKFFNFWRDHGILFAFIFSLIATLGSLFYSDVAKFQPCELCWYQRIFMYPNAVLLGFALLRKEKSVINYSLLLSVIGIIISAYHNYIYYGGASITSCSAGGLGASCVRKFVAEFGYITIPMMALTAFAMVIFFLLLAKFEKKP